MIDLALKNISRQRTRTILTVLGIVIGIAAVVASGSFAEGINRYSCNCCRDLVVEKEEKKANKK